ncbi:MAG TPA: 4-(cytidine 5'-diphospho)-2-C-methyl-D-erythritol kinase [Roseiarcus sp.]|nr:4-(cytidine 5'-diphospho)-2-C-methyl-D-erythritol kinase [Roseiarcus sp.]
MRWLRAPAKINLSLRVLARRSDGLHEIESLVAFAGICDWLGYEPGRSLELDVEGPTALEAGPPEKNLVLRAARALAARVPGLTLGRFRLVKRLPAAAGIGGGSADAAAALTALAESNGLSEEDERLRAAAAETGADVPVCLFPKARIVSGVGERLGPPVALPDVFAVLVNPRVSAPTRDVFEALGLAPGSRFEPAGRPTFAVVSKGGITLDTLVSGRNDLEPAALRVAPVIGLALETLSRLPGAKAARMSGSGSTCFALFDSRLGAAAAQRMVVAEQPHWWAKATALS